MSKVLNLFESLGPVDRYCLNSAADTPRKARMAFTQDFPLKIPVMKIRALLIIVL